MTPPRLRDDLQRALGTAYAIERELGGGGMSHVFLATETSLGRQVVIKTLATELVEGISAGRFAREVQVAARLQQANIVPVLSAGDANGVPYYTMPFVRGESLRARLATGTPLSLGETMHILRDIARALAFAHTEGVVHRDIKPENILLSGGTAVVTDFGIAKAVAASRTQETSSSPSITLVGSSLGTPAYMSPEQAAGDPNVDQRADIYAWGLLAWELLAGRHPFAGKTSVHSLVAAQMAEIPEPLGSVRADISPVLSEVVARCLEKEPARRPATAAELLASLDQATSNPPVVAIQRASNSRRSMRRALTIASTGIVLVAAGAYAFARARHGAAAVTVRTLAVIPFSSVAGDTSTNYLGEGIATEVTNTLSEIPNLRLAGRSSAARFAGGRSSAQEIGQSLSVEAVLDGTVRRVGDQIQVVAELSNASDGLVIWHQSYERAAKDVFAVQDEIAHAIAGQLDVTLRNAGSNAARGTDDAAAYDLYLKGMYLYRQRGPGLADAISALEQATTRDSNFARAWATLSEALAVSSSYIAVRAGDALPRARAAAERAVRLAPNLADGHRALGYALAETFDWKGGEAELNRAIQLDPGNADSRYRLGYMLVNQGRTREALPALQAAVARDPLYAIARVYLGWAQAWNGDIDGGLEEQRRALRLDPSNITTLSVLTSTFVAVEEKDSATFYAHRMLSLSNSAGRLGVAARALALAGHTAEAKAITQRLEATPTNTWLRNTGLVMAYAGLGDSANAVAAMERAAAGDGELLPTYTWNCAYSFPTGPRALAVWKRYNLDPAKFARPVAAPR
ncbi:MAG TPA: protein kinase [Gemmatimonadaceae bacterium]|nr:protein kinase [Gemmatimonadaceae bacterium]